MSETLEERLSRLNCWAYEMEKAIKERLEKLESSIQTLSDEILILADRIEEEGRRTFIQNFRRGE